MFCQLGRRVMSEGHRNSPALQIAGPGCCLGGPSGLVAALRLKVRSAELSPSQGTGSIRSRRRARGPDSAHASGRPPPTTSRRLVTVAASDPDLYRANLEETPTLDYGSLSLVGLPDDISHRGVDSRRRARMIHEYVAETTTPLYSLAETRPASVTERKGAGSCSQRFALVEAIARRVGIPTRVEGLAIRGTFWAPRFPELRFLLPRGVVIAWPEFLTADGWLPIDELSAERGREEFTNCKGGVTLFEASQSVELRHQNGSRPSFSGAAVRTLGYYDRRDDLFREHSTKLPFYSPTWAAEIILRLLTRTHHLGLAK